MMFSDEENAKKMAELQAEADRLHDRMMSAASCLAYDVTIRAANPDGPGHDKASPQLTRRLSAEYVEAFTASDRAYAALRSLL